MKNHTPLPWKVYYAKNNGQVVLGTGEENGCAIQNHNGAFWRDDEEAKANCEFVVKACNSHYELLEALNCAKAMDILNAEFMSENMRVWALDVLKSYGYDPKGDITFQQFVNEKIENALSKARG